MSYPHKNPFYRFIFLYKFSEILKHLAINLLVLLGHFSFTLEPYLHKLSQMNYFQIGVALCAPFFWIFGIIFKSDWLLLIGVPCSWLYAFSLTPPRPSDTWVYTVWLMILFGSYLLIILKSDSTRFKRHTKPVKLTALLPDENSVYSTLTTEESNTFIDQENRRYRLTSILWRYWGLSLPLVIYLAQNTYLYFKNKSSENTTLLKPDYSAPLIYVIGLLLIGHLCFSPSTPITEENWIGSLIRALRLPLLLLGIILFI